MTQTQAAARMLLAPSRLSQWLNGRLGVASMAEVSQQVHLTATEL